MAGLTARALVAALALGFGAGACGDGTPATVADDTPTTYEGSFTVLEAPAHGPELCAFVATSDPPQCGGVPVTNWRWEEVDGETSRNGTTWGAWHVVGTYDDGRLTLTKPPDEPRSAGPPGPSFEPACERPEVVDPAQGEPEWEAMSQDSHPPLQIDQLVTMWVVGSSGGPEGFVGNVVVRPGAGDAARAEIRKRYGGRLCVVERDQPLESDLRRVQDELFDDEAKAALGQVQSAGADPRRAAVVAQVWVVDAPKEAYAEERWGDLVILEGLLQPVP